MRNTRRSVVIMGGLVTVVVLIGSIFFTRTQQVEAAPLSQDTAVALAVKHVQMPLPQGSLVGTPTEARAKLTTQGEAYQLKNGRTPDAGTKLSQESKRAVWLVMLRGNFMVPNPSVPGQPVAPPLTYNQGVVIVDAATGEFLSLALYPSTRELAASNVLPMAKIPAANAPVNVPALIQPTEKPLPTRPVGVVPPGLSATFPSAPQAPVPSSPNNSSTATPAR